MNLGQYGPAVVGEAFDDPAFPQGAVTVESVCHDSGDETEQGLLLPPWFRDGDPSQMMAEVEMRIR